MDITQGIDIIDVKRIQKAAERQGKSFLNRIFTPLETKYCESRPFKFEHYAVRFAAKEAFIKAANLKKTDRYRLKYAYIQGLVFCRGFQ